MNPTTAVDRTIARWPAAEQNGDVDDGNDPRGSGVHLSPMEGPPAPPTTTFTPRVLLRSEQTGDQIAVIENRVPARWSGPPLHHHDFDEAFYLLDGELTFQLGDKFVIARPGDIAFAVRGAHRTLANLSEAPARYLLICTPASFERYFDRLAAEAAGTEPPREAAKPYPETVVVGPPIDADAVGSNS
jgi:quercetin dioxygenase-like cupin family protein